jgi:hypothetical protein
MTSSRSTEFFIHSETAEGPQRARVPHDGGAVEVDGTLVSVDLAPPDGTPVRNVLLGGGRSIRILSERDGDGRWALRMGGTVWRAGAYDRGQDAALRARKAAAGAGGPPDLRAPMPGLVVRIDVEPGMEVTAGQGLVIVEAMKMENELRAPGAARVRAVHVEPGMAVEKDAVLVSFEPVEHGGEG